MALRPDHEAAASISVAGRNACRCGNLTIRLHDSEGHTFATASMSPEIAEALTVQMAQALARHRAGGLGEIVCEGNA